MSTKIYEAYQIETKDINLFTELYRKQIFKESKNKIMKILSVLKNKNIEELSKKVQFEITDDFRKQKNWEDKFLLMFIFYNIIKDSKLGTNTSFNFDSSFNFWICNKFTYIIPYHGCFHKNKLNFLKNIKIKDFSYFNNVDKPEEIKNSDWIKRSKIWEQLFSTDFHSKRFSHVVIEGKFPHIGLNNIIDSICPKDKNNYNILLGATCIMLDSEKNATLT